jgi:hypothetical protein
MKAIDSQVEARIRVALQEMAEAMPRGGEPNLVELRDVPPPLRSRRGMHVLIGLTVAAALGTTVVLSLTRQSTEHSLLSTGGPQSSSAADIASDERGVAAIIRGVWTSAGTVCPVTATRCVDGVRVEGAPDDIPSGAGVAIRGWFDGTTMRPADGVSPWNAPPLSTAFPVDPCPGLSNHDLPQSFNRSELENHLAAISDRVAGVWVDQTSRLEVIWLVGAVSSEETAAIEQAARPMNVCVVGGARFNATELENVSAQIMKLEGERLIQTDGGHGSDVAGNVVVVPLQSISPDGRAAVDALGPRVVAIPFIELLDRALSSLPKNQPTLINDLEILTQSSRGGSGLTALATFTLRYDSSGQCVYLTALESDTRVAPVWPYGYSARGMPTTIFDPTGMSVASLGQELQLVGGYEVLEPEYFDGTNLCGATEMWIVSSLP